VQLGCDRTIRANTGLRHGSPPGHSVTRIAPGETSKRSFNAIERAHPIVHRRCRCGLFRGIRRTHLGLQPELDSIWFAAESNRNRTRHYAKRGLFHTCHGPEKSLKTTRKQPVYIASKHNERHGNFILNSLLMDRIGGVLSQGSHEAFAGRDCFRHRTFAWIPAAVVVCCINGVAGVIEKTRSFPVQVPAVCLRRRFPHGCLSLRTDSAYSLSRWRHGEFDRDRPLPLRAGRAIPCS